MPAGGDGAEARAGPAEGEEGDGAAQRSARVERADAEEATSGPAERSQRPARARQQTKVQVRYTLIMIIAEMAFSDTAVYVVALVLFCDFYRATARCYVSAVLAVAPWPSVRPSVRQKSSSTKTAKRRIT